MVKNILNQYPQNISIIVRHNFTLIMKQKILLFLLASFATSFCQAQFTTNLPIIKFTLNQSVVDSYRMASMEVIDNASGMNTFADAATFSSNAGIRLRGNATNRAYPKKSYSVETWTGFNISNNTSVLGLPAENDWVLLAAYPDRSLLRSRLSLELHDEMDRYAPRMVYCELFLDTAYQGVYLFGEKIKRDTSRLDLANLRTIDNSGSQLTGGYILQIDDENGGGFNSKFSPPNASNNQQIKFLYEYPDNGDITPAQEGYIRAYLDSFETRLNGANYTDTALGWRPYGANNAFIDYIIVNELTKNFDAYRIDVYLYKDRDKKMRPGPLWGYDASLSNTADCGSDAATGFAFDVGVQCSTLDRLPSFWWNRLLSDAIFLNDLKCRYTKYRLAGGVLDSSHINMLIDTFATQLTQMGAASRNFSKYPIFGTPIINEPMPMAANYTQEVNYIKQFLSARLNWLDGQWFDNSCVPLSVKDRNSAQQAIQIYPNPSATTINIVSPKANGLQYELRTIAGKVVRRGNSFQQKTEVSVENLSSGIYLLLIDYDDERSMRKIVVE